MLGACSQEAAPKKEAATSPSTSNSETKTVQNPMVTLKTNHGDIELELDAEKAPISVENFLQYAKDGHYDGTIFHRVIPGFMVQGGGFEPGMAQKSTNAQIQNEANNGLKNNTYTVAMARTPDPHSATSQFFINVKDNDFLNFSSESSQGWGYAVFGKVSGGEDVVKKIESVATGRVGPHADVPLEDVVIESVVVK
jgi:peptidyl-prolyl cis-trans isomerase B (cyclophilin B)